MTTSMKLMMSSALALLVTLPLAAQVRDDDPWFEIELLAFSRAGTIPLSEKFIADVKPIRNLQATDLLSAQYIPDLRPALLAVTPCQAKSSYEFTSLDPFAEYREPYDFETDNQPEVTYSLVETVEETAAIADTEFLPNSDLCQQFPYIRSNYAEDMMAIDAQQLTDNMAPLSLPTTPVGSDEHQARPYLAPDSALQLKDLAYQLRNRAGHDLLLHMVWRQALTSKSRASWQRLFAGKRFSPDFNYQGRKQNADANMTANSAAGIDGQIEQLYQRLNQQMPLPALQNEQTTTEYNLPRQVWQLDGQVRLYNERMLFIDSEFNFRSLSRDGDQLQSFYTKDNTRLLLEELHYLDHPYFGIIMQIRRFTPPLKPTEAVMTAPSIAN